jgi:hypothetical protein
MSLKAVVKCEVGSFLHAVLGRGVLGSVGSEGRSAGSLAGKRVFVVLRGVLLLGKCLDSKYRG